MLNAVRIWILLSTLLVSSGWILSALHQLNRAGYCAVFAAAAIACIVWQRRTRWGPQKNPDQLLQKLKRRFNRPAPFLFLRPWQYHAHLLADIPLTKNGHHDESSHVYIARLDPP
jgi:hypothetical protein